MNKIKTSKKYITASFVLLLFVLLAIPFSASATQEEKILRVSDTWEKDGWNLSVKAVDINAQPSFVLISLSYQGKKIGDAKVEHGKSYTYKGRNPDGSEVALFTVKANIFVGANADAVRLAINWSIPENNVQILEAPVESGQVITETPVPTPTAQANPEAPGFEMVLGSIGFLVVRRLFMK
ncbi:MAG: hypothetical protein O8C64_08480 [Candidatus Methanoperedens sp.]|nr:hypothetical protein [Candidatus Methanoperedens sp.]MCZ7403372.1 hypothetical protein [Candidatus Methanoperedens sp.]